MIVNLAVNARDAMPDGGKLTLRTANVGAPRARAFGYKGMPAADYVLVEVSDTGTGIPPDIIDKIFEPFFSTKEVGKGTGLGLSTVYGIVKQTGGFIYAECGAGQGHDLPHLPAAPRRRRRRRSRRNSDADAPALAGAIAAAERRVRPRRRSHRARHHPAGRGRGRLARAQCARARRRAATPCSRPATASRRSRCSDEQGGKVDLVVSDVVMPEMDGPTLLKELRKRNPDLKIIFVSGYAEDAFAQEPAGAASNSPSWPSRSRSSSWSRR